MANRHRNLFRERLNDDASERARAGLPARTHAEWAAFFNEQRPANGGRRATPVALSSISRALSNTRGIARRIGLDRAWILRLLGVDYVAYIEAWGDGPPGKAVEHRRGKKRQQPNRSTGAADRSKHAIQG